MNNKILYFLSLFISLSLPYFSFPPLLTPIF